MKIYKGNKLISFLQSNSSEAKLQHKAIPLAVEERVIKPDTGYNGFNEVTVQGLQGNIFIQNENGEEINIVSIVVENDMVRIIIE